MSEDRPHIRVVPNIVSASMDSLPIRVGLGAASNIAITALEARDLIRRLESQLAGLGL